MYGCSCWRLFAEALCRTIKDEPRVGRASSVGEFPNEDGAAYALALAAGSALCEHRRPQTKSQRSSCRAPCQRSKPCSTFALHGSGENLPEGICQNRRRATERCAPGRVTAHQHSSVHRAPSAISPFAPHSRPSQSSFAFLWVSSARQPSIPRKV
jgi:hypothetical protein